MPSASPSSTPAFCSTHGQAAGEPLAGIGAHPGRIILISWPKGKWAFAMREASDMEPPLRAAIAAATEAGWRINLIDRKQAPLPTGNVLLFPAARHYDTTPATLPELLHAISEGAEAAWPSEPLHGHHVLCCTHGKHDRCCAKFGFAAFRALEAAAEPSGGQFSVWESTHLGGCRFAATALVIPAMRKYGRITPDAAAQILHAEARGRAYLPCLRGSSGRSSPAQVAEIAALSQEGTAVPAAREVTELHLEDGLARFRVRSESASYLVTCRPKSVSSYGSCSTLAEGAEIPSRSPWVATEVSRLDAPARAADPVAAGAAHP